MWYPIAVHCPIAVHSPISGPKDRYRAVDRYSGWSYRCKRLEFRIVVAVHSLLWSMALQRSNLNFSSFRGETCDLASLSALILVPFPVSGEKCANRHLRLSTDFRAFFKSQRKFGEDSLVKISTKLLPGVWAG